MDMRRNRPVSNRIVLLVTLGDTGKQTPPLDPPTAAAVCAEIHANLASVWPSARITVEDVAEPMCSICRIRGRHNHACE